MEQEPAAAGAAMMELVRRGQFPPFALGPWYDGLKAAAADSPLPPRLAWATEDAILLAPHRIDGGHWGGYLIVMEEAAGQLREWFSEAGEVAWLVVPDDVGSSEPIEAHPAAVLAIDGVPGMPSSPGLQPL